MTGVCTACGIRAGRVEVHHVAGRSVAGVPEPEHDARCITTPLCVACHNVLTVWQREAWATGRRGAVAELATGFADLVALVGMRDPNGSANAYAAADGPGFAEVMRDGFERLAGVTRRPSPSVPPEIGRVVADESAGYDQAAQMNLLVAEVIGATDAFGVTGPVELDADVLVSTLAVGTVGRRRAESAMRVAATAMEAVRRPGVRDPLEPAALLPAPLGLELARLAHGELVALLAPARIARRDTP